ncbi:uncharacterized protein LOC103513599 [Diaphorina citri]|uniref:Uncharacterized protein LOC103513599 n=1 Tax=Diaphorina citri TaxID=121845 RepID=A0A1S3D8J3_DIACI|nr:uncharacterized protein LOC103513599 [Diaphorina citri]
MDLISYLLLALTYISHVSYGEIHFNETGDSIYHKNLRAKTDETVLCVDEYIYLHPHTERYLVAKLHQILHTCLNTYGKNIHILPYPNETLRDTEHRLHSTHLKRTLFQIVENWYLNLTCLNTYGKNIHILPYPNETLRDTEHRLHSIHLKRTLFQIVENWYLNLIFFTYHRLYDFRRTLHNVTNNYEDCKKKDIKRFWNHDDFFYRFFNQVKRHLREIIRYHYLNLEKSFYETNSRQLMHTLFMNATLAPHTIKFTQVFKARLIVDFFHDTPSTVIVSDIPKFRFAEDEAVTKRKRNRTTATTKMTKPSTTVYRPRIFNLSALGFTYPKMRKGRRTSIIMKSEVIRAADYENRTDLPRVVMWTPNKFTS